jgi:hypothetical protein
MIRPITALLLAGMLPLAACEPRETPTPRTSGTTVQTGSTQSADDDETALARCDACIACPQTVGGPQETRLQTRSHVLTVPGGASSSPRPVTFRELRPAGQVGVHITGMDTVPAGSTLRLSFAGCPADAHQGRRLGIARMVQGAAWDTIPGPSISEGEQWVQVEITGNSRYAVVAY